jgi:hypothetical protein
MAILLLNQTSFIKIIRCIRTNVRPRILEDALEGDISLQPRQLT